MDPFSIYYGIFVISTYVITGVIVLLLAGCRIIKPDKVARIMFPYIRRNGNNTVVFGFIFTKCQAIGFFMSVIVITGIYEVIWVFCTNIFIRYTNNNNPFSATSIELHCFYRNSTIAQLTAIERLETEEDIICYAINYNIAGAMGQATGALAFGWIVTSIVIWVALNMNNSIIQCIKNSKKSQQKFKFYECFLCFIMLTIVLVYIIVSFIIIGIYYDKQLYYYLFKPENMLILVAFAVVPYILDTNIKKEPKSLEECSRETMKVYQKELKRVTIRRGYERSTHLKEKKRLILSEMAEHECKRLIAYETAVDVNDSKEIKNIVLTAYNNILGYYNRDREEEEELTTVTEDDNEAMLSQEEEESTT